MYQSQGENLYTAQRAADTARGSAALPLNVLRVLADFNELKPLYRGWLDEAAPGDHEAVMGVVSFVLTNCAMREAHTTITALSVPALRTVLEFVETQFPETLHNTKLEMVGFLEFLHERDVFTGSDQLCEDLYDLVDDEEEIDWAEFHFPRDVSRKHGDNYSADRVATCCSTCRTQDRGRFVLLGRGREPGGNGGVALDCQGAGPAEMDRGAQGSDGFRGSAPQRHQTGRSVPGGQGRRVRHRDPVPARHWNAVRGT